MTTGRINQITILRQPRVQLKKFSVARARTRWPGQTQLCFDHGYQGAGYGVLGATTGTHVSGYNGLVGGRGTEGAKEEY